MTPDCQVVATPRSDPRSCMHRVTEKQQKILDQLRHHPARHRGDHAFRYQARAADRRFVDHAGNHCHTPRGPGFQTNAGDGIGIRIANCNASPTCCCRSHQPLGDVRILRAGLGRVAAHPRPARPCGRSCVADCPLAVDLSPGSRSCTPTPSSTPVVSSAP